MNKSTNPEQEKLARLFARLDENLAALQGEWEQMSRYDLICNSAAITAVRQTHEYLTPPTALSRRRWTTCCCSITP